MLRVLCRPRKFLPLAVCVVLAAVAVPSFDAPVPSDIPAAVAETARTLPYRFRSDDEGVVRASGDAHVVEADTHAVRFTSRPGSPEAARLNYTLRNVRVGETVLYDRAAFPAAAPETDGNLLTYRRSPILEERYENLARGVEQSFLIEERPAAPGDLVVEGSLEIPGLTPDGASTSRSGFRFRDSSGATALTIGKVTAVDAAGETLVAEMAILPDSDAHALSYTVPAAWLAEARFPVLVDPLVGSNFQINQTTTTDTQNWPAIAYDSANDRYLVVFRSYVSSTDYDLYGQVVDGDGTISLAETIILNDANNLQYPSVAFRSKTGNEEYLVVWTEFAGGNYRLVGRRVDTAGGPLAAAFEISPAEAHSNNYTRVAYNSLTDNCLVVWHDSDSGSYQIKGRRVAGGASNTIEGADIVFTDASAYGNNGGIPIVDVAADYEIAEGRFLVVFTQDTTYDIYGRLLNATTGSLVGATPFAITSTGSLRSAVVA
ncbi:MAG: hypothetical protein ACYTAF_04650, partial [Planctomycetota bacterium]